MDHKSFLKSLSAQDKAALCETDDRSALMHLALYCLGIGGLGMYIALGLPWFGLAILPLGILLAFLFNLSHECSHKTPFKSAWLNEVVGHVTGFILFQPFLWFRYYHLAHHRHTNDPGKDPELQGPGKPTSWPNYLVFITGPLYWRDKFLVLWANAKGTSFEDYVPSGARGRVTRESAVYLALYLLALAVALVVSPILFWIWWLPLMIGFPVLRLYHLAEHGHCPPVSDMFENTRTVMTNRIVRFVTWNMPYHAEHHTLPMVPFHRLPELHAHINAYLKSTSDGYIPFTTDYARGLSRR